MRVNKSLKNNRYKKNRKNKRINQKGSSKRKSFLRSKTRVKPRRSLKKISRKKMKGGGIPFGGTLKNLIGITNKSTEKKDQLLSNVCELSKSKRIDDQQLASLLTEVCSLNKEMKEGGGGDGIVKGALGLIGTVATLPLKTASNVVNNVTGVDPAEYIKKMILSSDKEVTELDKTQPIVQEQIIRQPVIDNKITKKPVQMGSSVQNSQDIDLVIQIYNKLKSNQQLSEQEKFIIKNYRPN